MPIFKRKYESGKTVWRYMFSGPGSTRQERRLIGEVGFASKREAGDAEANRRAQELQKYELAKAGATTVAAVLPTTLAMLLQEFFRQHAIERLALKTTERYRELAAALAPELMAMTLGEITPLHLHREWNRLLKSGGHHRSTKAPRALSAKTVRNVAGLASSAFSRAIKWGLIATNPVTNSEPPRVKKYLAIALTPAQLAMVLESASGPWCIGTYLELASATGCRRGELLALRWSDIVDGRAMIARSLTQTRDVLGFKCTKTEKPRPVRLPESAIVALEAHRQQQDEFRRQFGPDYRADLDLIFANPDGTMLKPDSISASVSALFKRLKIPKPKGAALHLLRHSHTSHLLASGVPLPAVSARLGHSSMRTTLEIYGHMIPGQDDEAARCWDEFQKQYGGLREESHKPV